MIENTDNVWQENLGPDPDGVILEPGVAGLSESMGTGGVGLPEIALEALEEIDDMERRELLVNPSDLRDPGDPEAGDVGVVGGLAAGGDDFLLGGVDPWGIGVAGLGGTGTIESELAEEEESRLKFETEK